MAKQVESVYGTALFNAGKEEGTLKNLLGQAKEVILVLDQNPEFSKLLVHPEIGADEKAAMVRKVFDGRTDDALTGLLVAATQKNHGDKLKAILSYFVKIAMEELKIGAAYVTSAVELREEQKEAVFKKLLQTTGYQEMEMHYTVEPGIIGGLIIQIGDRVVDSSIKTQLDSLKKTLI